MLTEDGYDYAAGEGEDLPAHNADEGARSEVSHVSISLRKGLMIPVPLDLLIVFGVLGVGQPHEGLIEVRVLSLPVPLLIRDSSFVHVRSPHRLSGLSDPAPSPLELLEILLILVRLPA